MIAEDIRPELHGKFSLMGIINTQINLEKDVDDDHATYSIAAYGEFERATSPASMYISLKDSDGEILTEGVLPVPQKNNKKIVLAGKFMNAKFKSSGVYSFSVKIDSDEYVKDFSVKVS